MVKDDMLWQSHKLHHCWLCMFLLLTGFELMPQGMGNFSGNI